MINLFLTLAEFAHLYMSGRVLVSLEDLLEAMPAPLASSLWKQGLCGEFDLQEFAVAVVQV
jgi:hypothetical protein